MTPVTHTVNVATANRIIEAAKTLSGAKLTPRERQAVEVLSRNASIVASASLGGKVILQSAG